MHPLLENHQTKFEQTIARLKEDLATMRVGRANPLLVENIVVDAYGARTPIKQLASISVPEARTILIQPWDKSITKEVEKGIVAANIGINPVNEGQQLRLTVPQLTEESRKELTKSVSEKEEKARVAIRQVRDRVKEEIVSQERGRAITEDDKYNLIKQLDELVKDYNTQIKEFGEKKVNEIMTI